MAKNTPKPTPPSPLKAYGYVRVSTEEQALEGISLDAQKEKIKSFASLENLNLIEIIADEGLSGKDTKRPGLQRLIELVKGQEAEAVIVYKLDRLSRKTRDLLFLIEETFEKGKTRFFSISEKVDTESALGMFFFTLMGALAQMERQLIAERTKMALTHKKEKGEYLGHVPYGFLLEEGKLVKNEEEQKLIVKMKRWRKEGKSYRKIAHRLNEMGLKTRKRGKIWFDSSVWYILNPSS
jgi:DNA invertase Pin-like site-specific DNA recombinase